MGAFFSVAGFFHSYYMTTLAPAICAFFGIGAVIMWRDYQNGGWRGWLLPFALVATAAEQISFIISNPDWGTWLIPLIALPCLLAALVLSVARMRPYLVFSPRVFMSVLSGGLAALLLTPAIWSLMPALQNAAISTPSAGPGRPGRFAHANAPASSTLIRYLEQNQGNATFLAAALSSRSTNALILATNKPVMAMGGFAGRDPILNTQKLATLVADGTVRFFLLNDPSHPSEQSEREKVSSEAFARSAGSFWSDRNTQTTLTTWITQHCTAIPASQWQASRHSASSETANNPTLLYDCATDK
jgi:4-amino-4-deoxy-L-arabinose transferase-like glycosyltransferase